MTALTTVGRRAFRFAGVRRIALAAAAMRGHGLVLVYHRIDDDAASVERLVPSVREAIFRQQLQAVLDAGDVVPLESLLVPSANRRRPRFALTFDDDWPTHHERALPILRRFGLTATFFLSGRSLHGLGALWFEKLDNLIAMRGIQRAARWLGIDAGNAERLALICESDPRLQRRLEELPGEGVRHLSRAAIRTLTDEGMTVGFHTLHHPLLSHLPDSAVDDALTRGRDELEEAAGRPVRLFAYPHGKADRRAVERLPGAGFVAACTGRPAPVRPGDDPYLLCRWEPGPIGVDRFVAGLAARVNGWSRGG